MASRLPTLTARIRRIRPGERTQGDRPADPRPAPSRRGYGRDWQRLRAAHLAAHPYCQDCTDAGRPHVGATEVDHVRAISAGGERLDGENLRAMCKSCHSRKTCDVDGGLGRRKGSK